MAKVIEHKRGLSRSTSYYFVIDDNKLVHISKYAFPILNKENYIEYYIDLTKLREKKVIEISVTNSGISCVAYEYPAEDLDLPFQSRRVTIRPLSYLNNLDFEHLTLDEKKFLQGDWKQYYIPMIERIRSFLNSVKNKKINLLKGLTSNVSISLSPLLHCQIDSGAIYPLSYLIPYSSSNAKKKKVILIKGKNLGKSL